MRRFKLQMAVAIVVALFSVTAATACMWTTGTTYEGESRRVSGLYGARRLRFYLNVDHRQDGLKMQAALATATNFNDRSDYGVSLVYLGRTKEAVEVFEALEKERAGTYFVAANLGTALELMGNNKEALRWIREGIRRNPQSHEGTEWLHAKILEAKVAQEKDPNYFKKHSVLDLDPAHASSAVSIDGRSFSPAQVAEAIQYQLQERLQFVKPPDPAVASLLFDYSAIEAATSILESAKELLQMAKEYGYPAERVQAQIKRYDRIILERKARQVVRYVVVTLVLVAPFVVLVILRKVA